MKSNASKTGDLAIDAFSQADSSKICAAPSRLGATHSRVERRVGLDQTRATACGNTTSISVPERPPVLIWNLARLASTRALVSDRLTPELSD